MTRIAAPTLDELAHFAENLADTARQMFAPNIGLAPDVEVKADRSLVTALDQAIEVRLRELIEARWPDHGIYGEEHAPVRLDAQYVWVLDPIDGTAAFIAGVPVFGTLIALMDKGVPVLGVIDLPVTQDRWVGIAEQPTLFRGQPCRTRACPVLADAMLTTSNPDLYQPEELPVLDALRARTRWRIYGTACTAYGLLASGRTDIAIDTGLKLWDYAPCVPIIEGAGGVITDWEGRPLRLENWGAQILAAGDPARHGEALALVRQHMTV